MAITTTFTGVSTVYSHAVPVVDNVKAHIDAARQLCHNAVLQQAYPQFTSPGTFQIVAGETLVLPVATKDVLSKPGMITRTLTVTPM